MGNKLPSFTQPVDYYMHDLNGYVPQQVLCTGRFLQTIKCLSDEGAVLVKIYIKRPPYNDLREQMDQLAGKEIEAHNLPLRTSFVSSSLVGPKNKTEIKANFDLISMRNVFPVQKFFETEKGTILTHSFAQLFLTFFAQLVT